MTTPLTYTAKAFVNAVNVNYPGSAYSSYERSAIEVELTPDPGAPVSFKGTVGLNAALGASHDFVASDLLGAPVEVTIRLMTKKTRVVSWKADEVPLGAWLRGGGGPFTFTRVSDEGVWVVNGGGSGNWSISFDTLAEGYEHSTDGGKTWSAAGRVEEVYE